MVTPTNFAIEAFSIASANDVYNRARPTYPLKSVKDIIQNCLSSNATVIELGAGTGIFTRLLLNNCDGKIENLIAVDPSPGMRQSFLNNTKSDEVSIKCLDGLFWEINQPDSSADLVVCAQSWHWCHKQNEGLEEIARVLKPNGYMIWIWNLNDRDSASWVGELRDVYEEYERGMPQFRHGKWKESFDQPAFKKYFDKKDYREYAEVLPTTNEMVKERILSMSYISMLDKEEKEIIFKKVDSILTNNTSIKWIDKVKGIYEYPYKTHCYMMRRSDLMK